MNQIIKKIAEAMKTETAEVAKALALDENANDVDTAKALGISKLFTLKEDLEAYITSRVSNKTKENKNITEELNKTKDITKELEEFKTSTINKIKEAWAKEWEAARLPKQNFDNFDFSSVDYTNIKQAVATYADKNKIKAEPVPGQVVNRENVSGTTFENENVTTYGTTARFTKIN